MTRWHGDEIRTPLGPITIAVSARGLCALIFGTIGDLMERVGPRCTLCPAANPEGMSDRVRDYFAGDVAAFDDAALDVGGTSFQRAVWCAVRAIPAGRTASYLEIARAIERPSASRAVGAANGSNRIALAIPCHRIVGSSGRLTGYAYGIDRKRWLLEHEARATRTHVLAAPCSPCG